MSEEGEGGTWPTTGSLRIAPTQPENDGTGTQEYHVIPRDNCPRCGSSVTVPVALAGPPENLCARSVCSCCRLVWDCSFDVTALETLAPFRDHRISAHEGLESPAIGGFTWVAGPASVLKRPR